MPGRSGITPARVTSEQPAPGDEALRPVAIAKGDRVVHHFGPDPASVGGMASVIRLLKEHCLGGRDVAAHTTWRPGARLASVPLALRACWRVPGLDRSDIVHVHLSEGGAFLREGAIVCLGRALGRTVVVTIHGANFLSFAARRRRLAAGVLRRVDFITCLDPKVLSVVRDLAPGTSAELLPNPVAIDDAAPGAHETDEVVLFAGEIGLRKGADVLCRAWPLVARSRPLARCIMVGPVNDFAVPSLGGLEVRDPVGEVELKRLLQTARVVVLPSRAEGMPMIIAEAMSEARPFVTTPVGGIPELAREGGVLVPVGDEFALAERLTELLTDAMLARRLGERGRRFCRETRSLEVVGAQLSQVYATASRS